MKKLLIKTCGLLLALNSVFIQTSCSDSNVDKLQLLKSQQLDSYVSIDDATLTEKVNSKEDLFVFVYMQNCSACALLKQYLFDYVKETNLVIYGIDLINYAKIQGSETFPKAEYTPMLVFYKDGKIVNKSFGVKNYSSFKKLVSDYCNVDSNIYLLNDFSKIEFDSLGYTNRYYTFLYNETSTLDLAISGNSKINILYSWDKCGDCINFFTNFMYSKFIVESDVKAYVFKVNYFRENYVFADGENDANKLWTDFSTKYGFNSYYKGKVPSIVRSVNGSPSFFEVYSNEGDVTTNSDGTFSYLNAYREEIRALKKSNVDELNEAAKSLEIEFIKNMFINL